MPFDPQHVPLWLLKQIAAYSALYECVPGPDASFLTSLPELNRIDTTFLSSLAACVTNGSNLSEQPTVPLDRFAKNVMASVSFTLGLGPPLSTPKASRAFADLEFAVQRIDCVRCAAASTDHLCDGDLTADSITIAEQGICITRLKTLFCELADLAHSSYLEYCTAYTSANRPAVRFGTAFVNSPQAPTGDSLLASGLTKHSSDAPESLVQLHFFVDSGDRLLLNRNTYFGVAYVLVHELICHAMDGVISTRCYGEPHDQRDYFSEGWMDWVAIEILRKALSKSSGGLFASSVSTEAVLEASEAAFHFRNRNGEISVFYRHGRETARDLKRYLERFVEPNQAWTALLTLSLTLNGCRESSMNMQRFVSNLRLLLPRLGTIDSPLSLKILPQMVREYLSSLNAFAFYQALVGIQDSDVE